MAPRKEIIENSNQKLREERNRLPPWSGAFPEIKNPLAYASGPSRQNYYSGSSKHMLMV
jgi:hypothetical protein